MAADQLLRDAIQLAKASPAPELARLDLFEVVAPLFWPLLNRCYVDILTVPPDGEIVIDKVALGAAPLSYPYQVGEQLVVTATLAQDGRRLEGSSVTTVQRDQAPLVIQLRHPSMSCARRGIDISDKLRAVCTSPRTSARTGSRSCTT